MNRRLFLQSLGWAATGLYLPWGQGNVVVAAATKSTSTDVSPRRLIVILLRGAVDGLSVVVPYADPEYYQARSTIALPRPQQAGAVLDLDGRFGLHPALAPLMPFWQQGKLAFVHACGSPDATRSHFDAQDYIETGTPGRKATPDGWMNRLLGQLPDEPSDSTLATRAVSIGPVLPRIVAGRMSVANIASGGAATRPTVLDRPAVSEAFAKLYNGEDRMSRAFQDAQVSHREVMASINQADLDKEMLAANNGAPLPNGFPSDAARLARLMRNDARVQLAFMALGGWDTHANQGAATGQLASRLAPLADGLDVLARGLGPAFGETVIVVISEFGRTVRQNGNGGTDHGHGNVMWLLGGTVAGAKVHGQWPGLNERDLYEGRDLPVTTDFRSVFAQVAERHLLLPDQRLNDVFPMMPRAPGDLRLIRS